MNLFGSQMVLSLTWIQKTERERDTLIFPQDSIGIMVLAGKFRFVLFVQAHTTASIL